jgi:Kef-type K+ transport system membrane component KefB
MQNEFNNQVFLCIFMFSIWFLRKIFLFLRMSPLIGEILAGIILGPHLLNVVPYQDALKFLGYFGMILLMIESGIDFQFDEVKKNWKKSILIALIGLILPFSLGLLFIYLFNYSYTTLGFILAAFSLAPTSIGLSLKVLEENKKLDSDYGQYIISIAVLDDIISIIFLSVVNNLISDKNNVGLIILFTILPILFTLIFGLFGLKYLPNLIDKLLEKIPNNSTHFENHDQVVMILFFIVSFTYSIIGHYIGSSLLGAFIAGLSFSKTDNIHKIWKHQVKRIAKWLITFFFAATIAFSIPISSMFNWNCFWQAFIILFVCGIFSKIIGPFLFIKSDGKWKIAWALVARGELSFIFVDLAYRNSLFDENLYGTLMWVFLFCCVISPLIFNRLVKQRIKDKNINNNKSIVNIEVAGDYHHNMIEDVMDSLEDMSCEIVSSVMYKTGEQSKEFFKVTSNAEILSEEDIKKKIIKALGDKKENIHVQIQDIENNQNNIIIKIRGTHHKSILKELCQKLELLDIEPYDLHIDHIENEDLINILIKKKNNENYILWKNKIEFELESIYKSHKINGSIDVII